MPLSLAYFEPFDITSILLLNRTSIIIKGQFKSWPGNKAYEMNLGSKR